jgi:hypothetical protein
MALLSEQQVQAGRKKPRTLAALLIVTLWGNVALLAAWGWAHRDEGVHAFLGVDGNKYRIVAENPFGRSHADWDMPYRYQRVLIPAAVYLLSLGQPEAIPFVMVGLNLAATLAATVLIGGLLARAGASPWWALVYGFAPGLERSVTLGHLEPVANLVVLVTLLAWVTGRRRLLWVLLALLPLVKEVYLLFLAAFVLSEVLRGTPPRLWWRWTVLVVPFLAWQGYVGWRFGSFGLGYHWFDVSYSWQDVVKAVRWNLLWERTGDWVFVLAQLLSLTFLVSLGWMVVRVVGFRLRLLREATFPECSLFLYAVLIFVVAHKVSYQLEAFFRLISTVLPPVFLTAGARVPRGAEDGDEGNLLSRLLSLRLVLGLSALLSVVCIPVIFLHLDSLPPDVFGGTRLHP